MAEPHRSVAPPASARVVDLSAGVTEWQRAWEEIPQADVYFHPGYAKVVDRHGEGTAHCLLARQGSASLIYPFLLRPIPRDLLASAGLPPDLRDAVTPYGYGGPLLHAADPAEGSALAEGARAALDAELQRRGVVCEFVRFHPVLGNHRVPQPGLVLEQRSRTVVVDLDREDDRRWSEMDPKARNKVRRAIRQGLTVERDTGLRHLEAFHRNYLATMRRNDAPAHYHYPLQFFVDTIERLPGMASLFVARSGERVPAAALILHSGPHAHYHFSGSDPVDPVAGSTNLLLDEVARWAREQGCRTFHLGGGRSPEDSLFRFKASLSPQRRDFWTGRKVHMQDEYERLNRAAGRQHVEDEQGIVAFFPPYRA